MLQSRRENGVDYNNDGERFTHNFLKRLPESYNVLREFRISIPNNHKQPDFIVIHPKIGLMIIDAKDWNLNHNSYTWLDQNNIEKRNLSDGSTIILNGNDNPFNQVENYKYIFIKKLITLGINSDRDTKVYVCSTICFPKISRQEFINSVDSNNILTNDQFRFYIDLKNWLFRDDLEAHALKPEEALLKIVNSISHFHESNLRDIQRTYYELMPPYAAVGTNEKAIKKARFEVKRLTNEQMNWVVNQDRTQNYLLDLPGSGKTSALISKAIYMKQKGIFNKQLIVTYSDNLKQNLNNLLKTKIRDESEFSSLAESIYVFTTDELVNLVYKKVEEEKSTDLLDVINILEDDIDNTYGLKTFDCILIDEIQDFDNIHLSLLTTLSKESNFFFVGDLSQKIYKRQPNLERLGFNLRKIELPKTYRMYRTPIYIAKLALKFLLKDLLIKGELENNGYSLDNIQYMNPLETVTEINKMSDAKEMIEKVESFNHKGYNNEQIMIITSADRLSYIADLLENSNIYYEKEYKGASDKIALVDFESSKGLEKEIVIVYGIEDLYYRSISEAAFDSEPEKQNKQSYSRRKIYIALTRTLESLIIYYEDTDNPFIRELLNLNKTLTAQITR